MQGMHHKADVAERESRLRKTDPVWLEAERERCRVKQAKANSEGKATHKSSQSTAAWRARNRIKARAHVIAYRALASGEIIRKEDCESCGATGRLQMHHTDYTLPKHVTFLCTACHGRVHRLENFPTEIHQPTQ